MRWVLRSEAMVALRIAMVALAVSFFGGLVFPGLRSPVALVLVPALAAAVWLYRRELRAGGWWTVGVAILVAAGLVLFMISPSYLGRLPP